MEKIEVRQVLSGHTSPETAYLVNDYPYGFRLRCSIRYWIETSRYGQRFVSQTTNPKRQGTVWNKPKAGTYSDLTVMFLDEKGHVHTSGLSAEYFDEKALEGWISTYGAALTSKYELDKVKYIRLVAETRRQMDKLTGGENFFKFGQPDRIRILGESKAKALEIETARQAERDQLAAAPKPEPEPETVHSAFNEIYMA